ncbi:MAG: SpoIID/LytB domain-containing protein, partial [Bacteroidetes bacterium]|nr:SpoIID/LytB domain-containing protein [Bacteroidota bacterium]
AVLLSGCAAPRLAETGSGPTIRVCIADRSQDVLLGIGEGAVIETIDRRFTLKGHRTLRLRLNEDGSMQVFADEQPARRFRGLARCYHRNAQETFTFEDRRYGDTLLLASDGAQLYVINVLPLEEYLKSVVPREIGRNRKTEEIEAVRAQAILARTYALAKIRLPLTRLFDVYDDTRDQVFGGVSGRDALATAAVEQTAGQALTFNGKLAECYFHSTCGGNTEASSLVWQRPQSKPYLTGVRDAGHDGDHCRIAPSYRWTEEYSRTELETTLRAFLPSANEAILPSDIPETQWHLLDVNILKRGASGRVTHMQIVMGNRLQQRSYYLHGDRVRYALRRPGGDQPLRSALFDIRIERDAARWITRVRFDGGGSGHGVGLCQWGAIGMARAGYSTSEILQAYFPGTGLRRDF